SRAAPPPARGSCAPPAPPRRSRATRRARTLARGAARAPPGLASISEPVHNRARSGVVVVPAPSRARPSSPPRAEGLRERNKREKRARIERAARELFER